MGWINLEDGTWAETPTPDPKRILTLEQLQEESDRLAQEISMYENEITHITQRKADIQSQKDDIDAIING
jgi:prefoldin subunit 5